MCGHTVVMNVSRWIMLAAYTIQQTRIHSLPRRGRARRARGYWSKQSIVTSIHMMIGSLANGSKNNKWHVK